MQDKEMLNDLVVESRDHLSEIEPDLLALEQKGDAIDSELINRIFRAVHSIKGGFGFFGIEHITKLSHAMENVMSRVRDKALSITPEVTEALLKGVDKLRILLDDVSHAAETPVEDEVKSLTPFLDKQVMSLPHTAKSATAKELALDPEAIIRNKHPKVTDEHIAEAVRNGKMLYQIAVNSKDLKAKNIKHAALFESWEKLGEVLDVVVEKGEKETTHFVIFATVLEPDLVSAGTGISDEQIYALDVLAIKARLSKGAPKKPASVPENAQIPGAQPLASANPSPVVTTEKNQKTELKIEDALRVKVGLLNNLMNLAGELVLSRNQLMQSVDRKLSEAVESDTHLKNIEQNIKQSFKNVLESAGNNTGARTHTQDQEQARLLDVFSQGLSMRLIDVPGLNNIIQNIDMVTSLLQESIMQTRLQPISVVFAKFPRLVRDLAKKLDKEINLTLVGQDVELDKSIIEQLSDPLTHLIRNSVDHGIELPQARAAEGKPAQGEVVLRAFHEGGKVHIQIEDDGAGINRVRVKEKALQLCILTQEALDAMTDREIDGIIMLPGFSTATVVSDVSGRGVGMDVVKTNIERLGGAVDIESSRGKGTTITMKLPLTLAIISSLIVSTGGRRFAIPQVGIEELVRVRAKDVTQKIDQLKNCEVMRLRGKLLPLVRLSDSLGMQPTFINPKTGQREIDTRRRWSDRRGKPKTEETRIDAQTGRGMDGETRIDKDTGKERRVRGPDRRTSLAGALKIIVLKYGEHNFGLVVEEVYDSEEIVVKPLSGYLKACQCYAGLTIMGDGSVSMILDTNGIALRAGLKFSDLEKDIEAEKDRFLKESTKAFRELLLFSTGENGNFGVDISMVSRVEKVDAVRINTIGGKDFLKYDDRSMRLIRLSDYLPVSPSAPTGDHTFVIVPKGVKHVMGIVADRVKDVVKTSATLDTTNIRGNGVQGSAIIDSRLTIVIDVNEIFRSAEPELCG